MSYRGRAALNRIDLPGTAEEAWDGWVELKRLPVADPLAWPSAVIVAAHPDDEILGAGGTLARLAARRHQAILLRGALAHSRAGDRGRAGWQPTVHSQHAILGARTGQLAGDRHGGQ